MNSNAFRYDAFISYSHHDAEWVQGWLLPRLEARGLKVCIDFRDFQPGATSVTEMERAVLQSRKTVLVLTAAYLAGEWTEFESVLAQTLDPAAHRRRVQPLLVEKTPLPPRLAILVYIDFTRPDRADWQLERLVSAIQAESN